MFLINYLRHSAYPFWQLLFYGVNWDGIRQKGRTCGSGLATTVYSRKTHCTVLTRSPLSSNVGVCRSPYYISLLKLRITEWYLIKTRNVFKKDKRRRIKKAVAAACTQRSHGAHTAFSRRAYSVLTAIIAFKIFYLFFLYFWVTLFCKHSDLFWLFEAIRHRI